VMVRMLSYPPDGGKSVMRSSVIVSNGKASGSVVIGKIGGFVGLVFTLCI
jgi:hypothetical protein